MKKIKTFATALLFAGGVYADPAEQQTQVQHPLSLQTTPDQGREINSEVSAKANKLANYVFERPTEKFNYFIEADHILAFTRITLDEKEYVVAVMDFPENSRKLDRLNIHTETRTSDGRIESTLSITDRGLDGNADLGFDASYTITPNGDLEITENKSYQHSKGPGLEHKDFFQTEYQNFLNKSLAFYEENTSKDDEWTSQDFVARTRKLKNFIVNSKKGDKTIQKDEYCTSTVVRFERNNKGYEVAFLDYSNEYIGRDTLIFVVHSLDEGRGRYLGLRDEATLGRVYQGESIFYKTKGTEELIPHLVTLLGPPIEESEFIQSKVYDTTDRETKREANYFQAEYDKVLDELIEFYESE